MPFLSRPERQPISQSRFKLINSSVPFSITYGELVKEFTKVAVSTAGALEFQHLLKEATV